MKITKIILLSSFILSLSACSSSHFYYWENPTVGGEQFVRDHNICLKRADFWPFTAYNPLSTSPEKLNLKLNLKDGGIWANFTPYKGSMAIFVNNKYPSKWQSNYWYSRCMKKAGYKERRPTYVAR
ncbi:MAG: hypothetical protein MJ247_06210 [Alphaproteobacteria bacterium]|nr:hypothetical protein [Alphaproteobacteria bacterium]